MSININGAPVYTVVCNGITLTNVVQGGVTVYAPPTVATNPVGASILDNQTHAMSAAFGDLVGNLTYQWYLNGGAISGATGASYTHPASAPGSYSYTCDGVNGAGLVASAAAVVSVAVSFTNTMTAAHRNILIDYYGYDDGAASGLAPLGAWTGTVHGQTCSQMFASYSSGVFEPYGCYLYTLTTALVGTVLTIQTTTGIVVTTVAGVADASIGTLFNWGNSANAEAMAAYIRDTSGTIQFVIT